jgi:hypothetical protein
MAKESGLGMSLSIDDSGGTARDIANDVNSLQWATPRGVQDITGINLSAMERLLLLADMSITVSMAGFNDDANMSHQVFRTVPSTSVNRTTTIGLSGQTLAAELLYTDYQMSRGNDGGITSTAPGALADGTVPTWT